MPYTEGDIFIPDEERTPCEIWDRVMGYYRPVRIGSETLWNIGKVQEHDERKRYDEPDERIVDYQTAAS